MSQEINDAWDKLELSKPVFAVNASEDGSQIRLSLVDEFRYTPPESENDSPIQIIANQLYGESFNYSLGKFIKQDTRRQIYSTIYKKVYDLYIRFSPLKNPKQSATSKWLYEMRTMESSAAEGIIALYKYAHQTTNGYFEHFSSDGHQDNFLNILELMRKKYE